MNRLVLHVLEAVEGGTARHLVDVVQHTSGWDHHVALPPRRVGGGMTDETAAAAITTAGGTVHWVAMRRRPASWANAAAIARLRRLIRQLDAPIVHGHSAVGGALARLAALGTSAATVYSPHAVNPGQVYLVAERILGRVTDRLVASSASEAEQGRHQRLVAPDRMVVVPNGIDVVPPANVELRATLGVANGVPLVGWVARLVEQKAPEVFVRAAHILGQRHQDAEFVLIGDGPLRALVSREIEASGLRNRFHYLPVAPAVAALLADLDVFVLTSRFEGAPYAPLEAMRAGTPVVLTDVVGNHDVVETGRSGLLVPPEDPVAVADAVSSLLNDADLAEAVAAAGRIRVAQCFDVRVMGDRLGQVYAELVQR